MADSKEKGMKMTGETIVVDSDSSDSSDSPAVVFISQISEDTKPKLKRTSNNNKKNLNKCNIEKVKCKIKSATVLKIKTNFQDVRCQTPEKFKATFQLFEKYASSLRSKCSHPSRAFHARRVAVFIVDILDVVHINRYLIVHLLEDGYLNSRLITILAYYTDMELCASLCGKETEIKVANRIILALNKYMDYSLHHIIEMFLTIHLRSTCHLNILSPVFKFFADCLTTGRPLSCRLYILYILFFKEWANLHHTNEEEQESVKNLAANLLRNKVQHISTFPRSLTKIIPFLKTAAKETLTKDLMNLNLDMPKTIASFLEYSNILRHTRGSDEAVSLTAKLCSFNKRFRQERIIQKAISNSALVLESENIVHDLTFEDGGLLSIMRRVIPAEEQDDTNAIESTIESNIPGGKNRDKVKAYFNSGSLEPDMITTIAETENCTEKLNELPIVQDTNGLEIADQNISSYVTINVSDQEASNLISDENVTVQFAVVYDKTGIDSTFVNNTYPHDATIDSTYDPSIFNQVYENDNEQIELHQNNIAIYKKPSDIANLNVVTTLMQMNEISLSLQDPIDERAIADKPIIVPIIVPTSDEANNLATTLNNGTNLNIATICSGGENFAELHSDTSEMLSTHMSQENHIVDNNSDSPEESLTISDIPVEDFDINQPIYFIQEASSSNQLQLLNPLSNDVEKERNDIDQPQGIVENVDNLNMSKECSTFANHEKEISTATAKRVECSGLSDTLSDNSAPVVIQNDETTIPKLMVKVLPIQPSEEYSMEAHNSEAVTAMDDPMDEENAEYYASINTELSTIIEIEPKEVPYSKSPLNRPEKTNVSNDPKVQISCQARLPKTPASRKSFPQNMGDISSTNRSKQKVQFADNPAAERERTQNRSKKSVLKKTSYLLENDDCLSDGVNKSSEICNVIAMNPYSTMERFDYNKDNREQNDYLSKVTLQYRTQSTPQIQRIPNHPSTQQRSTSQLNTGNVIKNERSSSVDYQPSPSSPTFMPNYNYNNLNNKCITFLTSPNFAYNALNLTNSNSYQMTHPNSNLYEEDLYTNSNNPNLIRDSTGNNYAQTVAYTPAVPEHQNRNLPPKKRENRKFPICEDIKKDMDYPQTHSAYRFDASENCTRFIYYPSLYCPLTNPCERCIRRYESDRLLREAACAYEPLADKIETLNKLPNDQINHTIYETNHHNKNPSPNEKKTVKRRRNEQNRSDMLTRSANRTSKKNYKEEETDDPKKPKRKKRKMV